MRIFSDRAYERHIKVITESTRWKAWREGFEAGRERLEEDPCDKDLRAGRITLNEYRYLKYNLPPIKQNKGE